MIVFFLYTSDNLHVAFSNFNDFESVINVYIDNICEMYSALKIIHDTNLCNSSNCQVNSFCDCLGNYLEKGGNTRSKRLLKLELIRLFELYPAGFRDCIELLRRGYITILPG